ncbi:MAG: glycosyltransferase [Chloroflexi bacterium]|nr:glycosyltransferase [Chloroflexota bacterium]MBT7081389.1 glycosyltransferase [Chloroflexota bacterium]
MNIVLAQNVSLNSNYAVSNTLQHLVRLLSGDDDIAFSLICGRNEAVPEITKDGFFSFHEIDTGMHSILGNIKYALSISSRLKTIHTKRKVDLIHARYPFSALLGATLFKKWVFPSVRIIYDIGSPWIEMMGERFKWLSNRIFKSSLHRMESFLANNVDGYYFQNEDVAEYYQAHIPSIKDKPCEYLNFELDSHLFEPRPFNHSIAKTLGIMQGDLVLGMVAGLARMREVDFVIKSFAKYRNQFGVDSIKMLIVGEGPERKNLQNLVKTMGLDDIIRFTGQVDHKSVPDYLSVMNMAISHLPNKTVFEISSPLKLMEYLVCGVPVLASNVKAHRRLCKYSSNVFLYENNAESFCSTLHALIKRVPESKEVLEERQFLKECFGSNTIRNNLVNLYSTVLS